jgi:hypothetical protein
VEVGGGWKLSAQRLDDLTETKPALGARQVQPASLLQELLDRRHQTSLSCAHAKCATHRDHASDP